MNGKVVDTVSAQPGRVMIYNKLRMVENREAMPPHLGTKIYILEIEEKPFVERNGIGEKRVSHKHCAPASP